MGIANDRRVAAGRNKVRHHGRAFAWIVRNYDVRRASDCWRTSRNHPDPDDHLVVVVVQGSGIVHE
jgi:hypothetical protein